MKYYAAIAPWWTKTVTVSSCVRAGKACSQTDLFLETEGYGKVHHGLLIRHSLQTHQILLWVWGGGDDSLVHVWWALFRTWAHWRQFAGEQLQDWPVGSVRDTNHHCITKPIPYSKVESLIFGTSNRQRISTVFYCYVYLFWGMPGGR